VWRVSAVMARRVGNSTSFANPFDFTSITVRRNRDSCGVVDAEFPLTRPPVWDRSTPPRTDPPTYSHAAGGDP
jgi:hypothetical protein